MFAGAVKKRGIMGVVVERQSTSLKPPPTGASVIVRRVTATFRSLSVIKKQIYKRKKKKTNAGTSTNGSQCVGKGNIKREVFFFFSRDVNTSQ